MGCTAYKGLPPDVTSEEAFLLMSKA
jgi:hypothetical protein